MGDIDPNNLGDPVYKYDQVVTLDDLERLRSHYYELEKLFYAAGNTNDATRACFAHAAMEGLKTWVLNGKQLGEEDEQAS